MLNLQYDKAEVYKIQGGTLEVCPPDKDGDFCKKFCRRYILYAALFKTLRLDDMPTHAVSYPPECTLPIIYKGLTLPAVIVE